MAGTNGASNGGAAATTNGGQAKIGTSKVKQGLAQMLKGGVIVSYSFKLWWWWPSPLSFSLVFWGVFYMWRDVCHTVLFWQ